MDPELWPLAQSFLVYIHFRRVYSSYFHRRGCWEGDLPFPRDLFAIKWNSLTEPISFPPCFSTTHKKSSLKGWASEDTEQAYRFRFGNVCLTSGLCRQISNTANIEIIFSPKGRLFAFWSTSKVFKISADEVPYWLHMGKVI